MSTDAGAPLAQRLLKINQQIEAVIARFSPVAVGIETVWFGQNITAAFATGQVEKASARSVMPSESRDLGFLWAHPTRRRLHGFMHLLFGSSTCPVPSICAFSRPISDKMACGLMLAGGWGCEGVGRLGGRSRCSKLRRRSITERGTEVCSNSHGRQSLPFPRRPWADLLPGPPSLFLLTKGGVICQQRCE